MVHRAAFKLLGPHRVAWLKRLESSASLARAVVHRTVRFCPDRMRRPPTALAVSLSFTLALFTLIAAYPTEKIYTWTKSLTERVFEADINEVSGKPNTWFGLSNKLVLPDQDFGVAEKLKLSSDDKDADRGTLSLRGRDLAGAVLDRVDLREADFTGAILTGASLQHAKLVKARFECGNTGRGSQCTTLRGAFLEAAQLQGTSLDWMQLQGASLRGAQLQGASLVRAQLQGAYLDGAQLQGAALFAARLQGASLDFAELQGAWLDEAWLQGASLIEAKLQNASLERAQLQGASLDKAQLQGASLNGVSVYRTTCKFGLRFHECKDLMAQVGRTYHQKFQLSRILEREEARKAKAFVMQWKYEAFVREVIDGLPTDALKRRVRTRLSVLNPIGYSTKKDQLDSEAWQTEPAAKSIPYAKHMKERSHVLRSLLCHGAEPRVVRAMLGRFDPVTVNRSLQPPNETDCPNKKGLTGDELRKLAALFDLFDRYLAEPDKVPNAIKSPGKNELP